MNTKIHGSSFGIGPEVPGPLCSRMLRKEILRKDERLACMLVPEKKMRQRENSLQNNFIIDTVSAGNEGPFFEPHLSSSREARRNIRCQGKPTAPWHQRLSLSLMKAEKHSWEHLGELRALMCIYLGGAGAAMLGQGQRCPPSLWGQSGRQR